MLLSFPYIRFGVLIVSTAKDLLLSTKYENTLGPLNVISVPKQYEGFKNKIQASLTLYEPKHNGLLNYKEHFAGLLRLTKTTHGFI